MEEIRAGLKKSMSEPAKAPKRDLGWMNNWPKSDPKWETWNQCIRLQHRRSDEDHSGRAGSEHVVECLDGCNYVARYDSSD